MVDKGTRGDEGTRRGSVDKPGFAYKRNFNRNPTGRFKLRMKRSNHSRSKSARG